MRKAFVLLRALAAPFVLGAALNPAVSVGQSNSESLALRGPRFLYASNGAVKSARPVDADRMVVLQRRIAVDLDGVTIESALRTISDEAGLKLAYRGQGVTLDKLVHLRASEITVAAALTSVLLDANVDIVFSQTGQAMLVRRPVSEQQRTGTIIGRVTDATNNESVTGVSLIVEGTRVGAVTGADGRYRLAALPAGAHTVTARRIGYAKLSLPVAVVDGQDVKVDFVLARVASRLEDVVATATGDQRRLEVGNAIGTISVDSVMNTAPVNNITDLLSGRVPGLQVYNAGGYVGTTSPIRIRGTNSFTVSNDPIVIIDGIRVENTPGINPPFSTANLGTGLDHIRWGAVAISHELLDVVGTVRAALAPYHLSYANAARN